MSTPARTSCRRAVVLRPSPRPALTPDGIAAVTAAAAREAGLPAAGARLVKFTNNAVVLLPAAGAVLRIAGSAEVRSRVPAVVATARWMAALSLPGVRLLPGVPQPLEVDGHLVTTWCEVPPCVPEPREATVEELAAVLRELHAVDAPPPAAVGPWDVAGTLRRRLAEADHLRPGDAGFLAAELEAVEAGLAGLAGVPALLPPGLVHGDAFAGNVVMSASGAVLCDFDGVAVGPREWDLVPVAVGGLRFGYADDLQPRFARAYGVDVTAWPGFGVLRRLRELQLVVSVVPVLPANPALRPQWRLRLESLRRGDTTARWSPYPWA